jgi:hypothetical protein
MVIFSFLLVVSFSFIVILTRNVISKLLYPRFVKAVREPKRKGWNEKKYTIGRFWSPDFGYLTPDCFINFSDK